MENLWSLAIASLVVLNIIVVIVAILTSDHNELTCPNCRHFGFTNYRSGQRWFQRCHKCGESWEM